VGIVSPIVRAAACGQVARWVYILCLLYSASGGGVGAIMEIKGIKPLQSGKPKRHSDCCLRKAEQKLGYYTLK